MIPKMLETSKVYEQKLDKNREEPCHIMLGISPMASSACSGLISYEIFEQEINKYDKEFEVLKAVYKALPILRAQAEAKTSIPDKAHNEVQATVRTLCNKLADGNMRCYYNKRYYNNDTIDDMDVEFKVNGENYMIPMGDYIDMMQCRQWLSERKEFDVKLVSMDGAEQNDTLADLLYTSYYNHDELITRNELGFSVDMDAVNDRLIEMEYRPFAVPKIEYKAVTIEELRKMQDNSIEEEQDERDI